MMSSTCFETKGSFSGKWSYSRWTLGQKSRSLTLTLKLDEVFSARCATCSHPHAWNFRHRSLLG